MAAKKKEVLPEEPIPVVEEEKPRKFSADYKFASEEVIRNVTVTQLAKLEAELHQLRIVFYANGENPNMMVAPKRTIGQEVQNVMDSIERLSEYFSSVLED